LTRDTPPTSSRLVLSEAPPFLPVLACGAKFDSLPRSLPKRYALTTTKTEPTMLDPYPTNRIFFGPVGKMDVSTNTIYAVGPNWANNASSKVMTPIQSPLLCPCLSIH
jgi:hypothetical protein